MKEASPKAIYCVFNYMMFWEWHNHGDSKKTSSCPGLGEEREHRGFLGLWRCRVWYHQDRHRSSSTCPDLCCTAPRVGPVSVSDGLGVTGICQCGFTSCDEGTTLSGEVHTGGLCMCGGRGYEENFCTYPPFCYETTLYWKNKAFSKKLMWANAVIVVHSDTWIGPLEGQPLGCALIYGPKSKFENYLPLYFYLSLQ